MGAEIMFEHIDGRARFALHLELVGIHHRVLRPATGDGIVHSTLIKRKGKRRCAATKLWISRPGRLMPREAWPSSRRPSSPPASCPPACRSAPSGPCFPRGGPRPSPSPPSNIGNDSCRGRVLHY